MPGGAFDNWVDQASNPAAPSGLSQAAQAAQGAQGSDPRYGQSSLGQWIVDAGGDGRSGYAENAQSWFTGANREGETNGWGTQFWQKAVDSYNAAAEAGQLVDQFSDPQYATGVITFDHDSTDGSKHFSFGDVYEDGEFKGNVYQQFDKPTADLMMGQMLFDGKALGRMLEDSDRWTLSPRRWPVSGPAARRTCRRPRRRWTSRLV